jgi:hypothetical protein
VFGEMGVGGGASGYVRFSADCPVVKDEEGVESPESESEASSSQESATAGLEERFGLGEGARLEEVRVSLEMVVERSGGIRGRWGFEGYGGLGNEESKGRENAPLREDDMARVGGMLIEEDPDSECEHKSVVCTVVVIKI